MNILTRKANDLTKEPKKKISVARRVFSILFFIVFLPVIAIVAIFRFAYRFDKRKKFEQGEQKGRFLLAETDLSRIDIMEGYEFEELVKTIYFYLGYGAELTQKSKDFGADVVLTSEDGKKIVVQAKRYSKPVGARSVQEIAGARDHYAAQEAWVVTNSTFTDAAETLARETDVRLVDRSEFVEHFSQAKANIQLGNMRKEQENIDSTSFDGFGQGEFRI